MAETKTPAAKMCFGVWITFGMCILNAGCEVFYKEMHQDVTMQCGQLVSNQDVEWRQNNVLVVKVHGKSGRITKGTIPVAKRSIINENSLAITKVISSDSGEYMCVQTKKTHTLHVISASVRPSPALEHGSAELRCDVGGKSKASVAWLGPDRKPHSGPVLNLNPVTSADQGIWVCRVIDGETKTEVEVNVITLGLVSTENVSVPLGGTVLLPCSLSSSKLGSLRVVGGGWSHPSLPLLSLSRNGSKALHWIGIGAENSAVQFDSRGLETNFAVKLKNVKKEHAGQYDCTVKFENGGSLKAKVVVLVKEEEQTKKKSSDSIQEEVKKKNERWMPLGFSWRVWVTMAAGIIIMIGLIILVVKIHQRNKRMKWKAHRLRTLTQPLTVKDYCQCNRSERTISEVRRERPISTARQPRNLTG